MKTMMLALLLGLSLTANPTLAQEPLTGQFNLGELTSELGVSPKVNINFGPAMMAGFAETLAGANADLAEVLKGVSGLRLMVFENIDTSALEPRMTDAIGRLDRAGWTPAVTVEDDDTLVDIYMIESGQFVKGLVMLVRDGGSTVVLANIHGDLDPVVIGRLISSGSGFSGFDIGSLMGHGQ